MASYLKTFYPQSEAYQARFNIGLNSRFDTGVFGLGGDTGISFSLSSGILWHDGKPLTSLDSNSLLTVDVCGSGANHTVWAYNSPVFHSPSALSFDRAIGNFSSGASFTTSVVGTPADISHSLSGMLDDQSGYLYVVNHGQHDVDILSATWEKSYSKFTTFPSSIAPGETGSFLFELLGNNNISGTGVVNIQTNGGAYTGNQFTSKTWEFSGWGIPIYSNPGISYPSGESNFYVINESNYDREFYVAAITGYPETGRYAEVTATGSFTTTINQTVTGVTLFPRDYSGVFVGQGGRLNAMASSVYTGSTNVQISPTGSAIYNYQIESSGIIMGELFYGLLTGAVSGESTGTLGGIQFSQQETGSVNVAYSAEDGEVIYPDPSETFTGYLSHFEPVEQYYGNADYNVYRTVEVFEGSGEFQDIWNLQIDDHDSGTIDYGASGYSGTSGFFNAGLTHRIPAKSTLTGRAIFASDYQRYFNATMQLIVTETTSVTNSIYIST